MQYTRLGSTGLVGITVLDQMTAPPAQYPGWFTTATTDPKHKTALSEARAKLAAGASGN